jgi:hypothetical protein
VYYVSETAQVELICGRVRAPAWRSAVKSVELWWFSTNQGLTLVQFSAQRKRFLLDKGV